MKVPAALLAAAGLASAATIAQINGNRYISPLNGTAVTGVEGLVIAKGPSGIWIRSTTPDDDPRTSEAIYVYSSKVGADLAVGDIITVDGSVYLYRSDALYVYLTEISSPTNVKVLSSGNPVTAYVIGEDTPNPPTEQFSSLDGGDIFSIPNDRGRLSVNNPLLDPSQYGMDFWQSLMGELVTVKSPVGVTRPNQYGDTWVVGTWPTTGRNEHGGLTMMDKDANPEAILIGDPLDGTNNPQTKMGDSFEEVTGVVTFAFGYYRILPLTRLTVTQEADVDMAPTTLVSRGDCRGLTFGSYNVENLYATASHLPGVAAHIVDYMKTPDLIFVQEIQDNNGPTDNGVVSANVTLATLIAAIQTRSGVVYDYAVVDPVNNQDGGQTGGNIRPAYLYRPDVVELWKPNQASSTDQAAVLEDGQLSFNPGRIDINNAAWSSSRKPLVAAWRAIRGPKNKPFYTINVHNGSKSGSSSIHGDARPPINSGVEKRGLQTKSIGTFVDALTAQDPKARIIIAGDFNEYPYVQPQTSFVAEHNLTEIDTLSIPATERYSYVYDMNAQQLDHIYISPSLVNSVAKVEHLHISSHLKYDDITSDHDPLVSYLNVCGC